MANPLDGLTRVYINGDAPPGDPMGTGGNALSQVTGPTVPEAAPWTIEDLQKGIQAIREYVGGNATAVNDMAKRFTNYDRQFTEDVINAPAKIWGDPGKANDVGQRFMGGENWLSNMVTNATTAPGRAAASETPITSEEMIAPAQDIAGMATGSMLFGRPGAGTLGSGPLRPGARPMPTEAAVSAPVFYSALEHAATNAAQETMSPQQWLGFLKNQPGVKAEELAWTGLPEWLGTQKGKVKKEDVQAYLDEHKVEIKDVTKKNNYGEGDDAVGNYLDEHGDRLRPEAERDVRRAEPGLRGDEFEAAVEEAMMMAADDEMRGGMGGGGDVTKYSSYQLPGGENYREHLLTMPEQAASRVKLTDRGWEAFDKQGKSLGKFGSQEAALQRAKDAPGAMVDDASKTYRSSHWDEPNVLAHVRTNDRTIGATPISEIEAKIAAAAPGTKLENMASGMPAKLVREGVITPQEAADWSRARGFRNNGFEDKPGTGQKSLHIEEIQSDWHQQGRKQGYKGGLSEKDMNDVADAMLKRAKKQHRDTYDEPMPAAEQTEARARFLEGVRKTPNDLEQHSFYLPDLKNRDVRGVPDAPFKTTWPELALKRMIRHAAENGYERISWTPGEAQAARYDLSKQIDAVRARKVGDKYMVDYTPKGKADDWWQSIGTMGDTYPAEKLPDLVGKDLAQKIVEEAKDDKFKTYKGVDLKVGGEGMREFYDKMLPKMVEKLGKAHGVKVKQANLNESPYKIEQKGATDWVVKDNSGGEKRFKTEKEARKWADEVGPVTQPVHYFDLPESLRHHAVGKGFPLYMSGVPFPLVPVDHNPFEKKKEK